MKRKVELYESNAGSLDALVYENGTLVNVVSDLEQLGKRDAADAVKEMLNGFVYADEFELRYGECTLDEAATSIRDNCDMIAFVDADGLYVRGYDLGAGAEHFLSSVSPQRPLRFNGEAGKGMFVLYKQSEREERISDLER